jgi:hypothetical protein
MLIRREQMDVFAVYMMKRFEERMATHLRQTFPEPTAGMPQDELIALIRAGIATAGSYGLEYEDEIERYLDYMMIYGRAFDSDPRTSWAGFILRSAEYAPTKLRLLEEQHWRLTET